MSNRMSKKEYLREINRVHSARKGSSLRKDNSKTKVRKQTVSSLQGVLRSNKPLLHEGPFRIEVEINGKCRADIDNVLKGVLDALNGVAYNDDRQCIDARVLRKS